MPTINIVKTVSNLASVTGLSFTATAVQSNVSYPLTATYSAPNLTLTSSGSVGVAGNFTFNVTANYTAFGTACSDSISFVENIVNNFTNLRWSGYLPNANAPFAVDNVGVNEGGFNFTGGAVLINNNTNTGLKLLSGNAESVFEFYYTSNSGHSYRLDGVSVKFVSTDSNKGFGIGNGSNCGVGGALHQLVVDSTTEPSNKSTLRPEGFTYDYGFFAPCNVPSIAWNNNFFNVGYIDSTYLNTAYPKTKFKFRTINGNYELYKNDVLVGTLPYDNTKEYTISMALLNAFSGLTNVAIQLLTIEGNFQ